jgi:hypothetical protein
MVLKAYVDDSNMGAAVASVLGGWVATAETWDPFSDEWQSVLAMKPHIGYFKWSEAWSLKGEFSGISEESRDEKIRTLVRVIRDHNPLAVTSVMPNAKVDFIFDVQAGQMEMVSKSWDQLIAAAPPKAAANIGSLPKFRQSVSTMPLQAADLCAGWTREEAEAAIEGRKCRPVPWGKTGDTLMCIGRLWTRELLEELRDSLTKKGFG